MGSNRLPYFKFCPMDWLSDPKVMGMSAAAEGCYIRLLARSWVSETPGRVPHGLAPEMGGMHRLTDEEAPRVFESVRSAFDTDSEKGVWVQRRMVREYERLSKTYEARREGALRTLELRAQPSRSPSRSPGVEARSKKQEEETAESTHSSPAAPVRVRSRRKVTETTPLDREWEETFHEVFWPEWLAFKPGCSKADALRAWRQVPHPEGQPDFDRIDAAFSAYRESKASEPTKYRKDASTWINMYRRDAELEGR